MLFKVMFIVCVTKVEQYDIEQQYVIKFCAKFGDSAKETIGKLVKVFGEKALSHAQILRWHKKFKNGREKS